MRRNGESRGLFVDFVDAVYQTDDPLTLLMEPDAFVGVVPLRQLPQIERMNARQRARWLIGRIWHCTDIMPCETCCDLDLPQGSRYSMGARVLLEVLRPELKEAA